MQPSRSALIVASQNYRDRKLRKLRSPARDAEELGRVLADPQIGGFKIEVLLDENETTARRKLEAFFKNRARDDFLLLHISCHGVKDDQGDLYFATPDTDLDHLESTAIGSYFVERLMHRSLSRRILLLLDCCYSGAFSRGALTRAGDAIGDSVGLEKLQGNGRVVLTASNSTEYAFEGDEVTGSANPSVFTAALVRALKTGEADRDQDSRISVDELYDYLCGEIPKMNPKQTPQKWSGPVTGQLYVASSSFVKVVALPDALETAAESPLAGVREGAVGELGVLLKGKNRGLAEAARLALTRLTNDDSQRVRSAALAALGGPQPSPETAVGGSHFPGGARMRPPDEASAESMPRRVVGRLPRPRLTVRRVVRIVLLLAVTFFGALILGGLAYAAANNVVGTIFGLTSAAVWIAFCWRRGWW